MAELSAEDEIDQSIVKDFFFKSPGMGNHSYIVTSRKDKKVILCRNDGKVDTVDIGVVIRTVLLTKGSK